MTSEFFNIFSMYDNCLGDILLVNQTSFNTNTLLVSLTIQRPVIRPGPMFFAFVLVPNEQQPKLNTGLEPGLCAFRQSNKKSYNLQLLPRSQWNSSRNLSRHSQNNWDWHVQCLGQIPRQYFVSSSPTFSSVWHSLATSCLPKAS